MLTCVGCCGFSEFQPVFSRGLGTNFGHFLSDCLNAKGLTGPCIYRLITGGVAVLEGPGAYLVDTGH